MQSNQHPTICLLEGSVNWRAVGHPPMLTEHEIEIRVRYPECDPMGFLHHSRYFIYFEMGRTELLRASGGNYRRLEEEGVFVVVVKAECKYHRPAKYDDVLRLRTTISKVSQVKIEHTYELFRDSEKLVTGHITMAMVDREGRVQQVPDWMLPAEETLVEEPK